MKVIYSTIVSQLSKLIFSFLLLILSIILVFPFLSLVPISFNISNAIFNNLMLNNIKLYLIPSFIILLSVIVLSTFIALITSWLVVFYNFPFVKFFRISLIFPLAIPTYINAIIYAFTFEETLPAILPQFHLDVRNIIGVIIIMSISLYPYIYLLLYNHFRRSGEIINIAKINGKTHREILFKVAIPNAKYVIILGMLFVGIESLSEFGIVKYFNVQSLTVGIYDNWFFWGNYQNSATISFILIIVTVSLALLYSFFKKKKDSYVTIKNKCFVEPKDLKGLPGFFAFLICAIIIFLSFIFPLGKILFWLIESRFQYIDRYFIGSLTNSLFVAFLAAAIIAILSIVLVYFKHSQYNNKFINLLLKYYASNYVSPGPIIAVGVLSISMLFFPGNGSIVVAYIILIYAYTARFLVHGFRDVNKAYEKIPLEVKIISHFSLKNSGEKIRKVFIPLISNKLIVSYMLIFIEIVKELPVTFFLKNFDFDTLSTRTYELAMSGNIQESSITAFAIIIINIWAIYFLSKNFSYKDGVKWQV